MRTTGAYRLITNYNSCRRVMTTWCAPEAMGPDATALRPSHRRNRARP